MATPARRDREQLAAALGAWLAGRLGCRHVGVTDLVVPKAGYSNETVLGTASWDGATGRLQRSFALRIEPTGHRVFVEADALRQARVLDHLAGLVPVPGVWLTESDPSVLGAPFYLMDRVEGRVPADLPSWHARGWTTKLPTADQARLYDNALRALVGLHRVEWSGPLAFLDPPGPGSHLDRYVAHVGGWHEWCAPVLTTGADIIDAALRRVRGDSPAGGAPGIVWGDARVGNIIFGPGVEVAAMLDWESASIGPPEIDLGWWLMFEQFVCEEQGLARLPGVPGRQATLERYEELSGYAPADIGYYEILAALVFSLVNSRIADLLVRAGTVPPAVATEYVTRVTAMLARWLER